jgi:hypothetical protein
LVPRFDETLKTFCLAIASRRNKELHSAELPFQSMRLDAWEAQYWHACDTILHQMGSSLEEWMGATDSVAPRQVLMEAENALKSAVQLRVKAAAEKFKGQTNAERGRLAADAQLRVLEHQTALFKGSYDNIWAQDCPACNCRAFMAGEQSGEFIEEGSTYFDDERDEDIIWEFVHRQFFGAEFRCPTCDLGLMGSDEIEAADLNYIHRDTTEREMAYEPDYGND